MKTKKIPLIALSAAAVALGAGATDVTIEGQWLVGGTVQRSAASDCSLNVYGAEGASSALWTTNGVPFATDANGSFVVCVSTPAHLALPDTFWVGVAPAGQGEISPRFRIAPVPFAFAADEVQLVSAERNIELTGIATVDHLAVSGNVKTKDFVVATNSVLRAKNLQLDSAKIVSLDVPNAGMLGLFNAKGATPSFDYDAFSAEKAAFAQVSVHRDGFMNFSYSFDSSTQAMSHSYDSDGLLMFALKCDPKKCPAPRMTVRVGDTTIVDRTVGSTNGGAVKRFMTIPYRAGEIVSIAVKAIAPSGSVSIWEDENEYKAYIGAKMRLMRFGRD